MESALADKWFLLTAINNEFRLFSILVDFWKSEEILAGNAYR